MIIAYWPINSYEIVQRNAIMNLHISNQNSEELIDMRTKCIINRCGQRRSCVENELDGSLFLQDEFHLCDGTLIRA